jgi:hypothetical protein
MANQYRPVAPALRRRLQLMQALEDAIAFRLARTAVPCPACATVGDGMCDDHACDVALINAYRRMLASTGGALAARSARSRVVRAGGQLTAVARR